jgi:hypothetical protein
VRVPPPVAQNDRPRTRRALELAERFSDGAASREELLGACGPARAAVQLSRNRGIKGGVPTYEDVTEKVGLSPLAMKAPHVEIQGFNNDGWPDIYASTVKFADGKRSAA